MTGGEGRTPNAGRSGGSKERGEEMSFTNKIMAQAIVLLVLASAIAFPALGQQDNESREAAARRERDMRAHRERDLEQRSRRLREMGKEARRPPYRLFNNPDPRLAFTQIKQDFIRLQLVNNKLRLATSKAEFLDLKFVAKSASELKKIAGRLKSNLMLPEPDEAENGSPAAAEQLRSSIAALDRLVIGFVKNPIFNETSVLDVRLSAKAHRNLEEIIELSGQVERSSEILRKAGQKL